MESRYVGILSQNGAGSSSRLFVGIRPSYMYQGWSVVRELSLLGEIPIELKENLVNKMGNPDYFVPNRNLNSRASFAISWDGISADELSKVVLETLSI